MSQSFIPRFDFHYSEVGLYTKTTSLRTVIPFVLKNSYLLGYPTKNSLFDSEFVDVLKCNHCPCVNMEQHMHLSLLMYIGQQTDVNFVAC